jgi:replicative DNA helicase
LSELYEAAPSGANAVYYACLVREQKSLRDLIHVTTEILREAYDRAAPAVELIEQAESKIFAIAERSVGDTVVPISVAVNEARSEYDMKSKSGSLANGVVPTGWIDLDKLLVGFHAGELIVIGARPSIGKTTFATAFLSSIVTNGAPALFFSLEQKRSEIANRMICAIGEINADRVRRARLSKDDFDAYEKASALLRATKLYTDDSPRQTALRFGAAVRRSKRKHGIRVAVIDYLQLIQPANNRVQRWEQVSEISRYLKIIAREANIPIVALAQLNRESEKRPGQPPRLSDLRESGNIEQDADVVLLLHAPADAPGTRHVFVAKQRNGPVDTVVLAFNGDTYSFHDYAGEL